MYTPRLGILYYDNLTSHFAEECWSNKGKNLMVQPRQQEKKEVVTNPVGPKAMVTQEEEDDVWERLCQTQVWINGPKPLYVIFHGGIQRNFILERTVQRLILETQSHVKPY
jgi:hypothetical protein